MRESLPNQDDVPRPQVHDESMADDLIQQQALVDQLVLQNL